MRKRLQELEAQSQKSREDAESRIHTEAIQRLTLEEKREYVHALRSLKAEQEETGGYDPTRFPIVMQVEKVRSEIRAEVEGLERSM